jgi:hypothetical protein
MGDDSYEIHYRQDAHLPLDHHDKDAYLTMGAFVETMTLQAPNHNLQTVFTPELTKEGTDLFIGHVAITPALPDTVRDPLSDWVGSRVTNRNKYSKKEQLPSSLTATLAALGNTLVYPDILKGVVLDASRDAWADTRYIADLEEWFHPAKDAKDGITPKAFNIDKATQVALKFAFWHGPFKSKLMSSALAAADVGYFTKASRAAVLSAEDMTPEALFDAGRRLLRSWVTIVSDGFSYQPFSVGVDEAKPAARVAEITGVENPVALYRIGKAKKAPRGVSPRKTLKDVLI